VIRDWRWVAGDWRPENRDSRTKAGNGVGARQGGQAFAGEENENEKSDAKTGEKLAIEKVHVADSRELAAISTPGVGD
jgi:hypothetical protein